MPSIRFVVAPLAIAGACALLAACGGGGSSSPSQPKFKAQPFAPISQIVTSPDTQVTSQLYASSLENKSLTYRIKAKPAHGTASLGKNSGVLTYTPDAGFTGSDRLTYVASTSAASSLAAAVTILVNPDPPTVSAFGAPVYVHDGGPPSVALKVRLSNPPNGQATVDYTTVDGTAQAGTDYTSKSGTLTFGPGDTSQTVTIPLSDAEHVASRYFYLKLSNASSNLTMGTNLAAAIMRYYPEPLNDTGVTGCATTSNGNPSSNDSCPQEGYPAQDAEIGRDAASFAGTLAKAGSGIYGYDFTALGGDGKPLFNQALNSLNYAVQPWACVRDNWTGLTWEVPTPGSAGGLYDTNYYYSWYNPDSQTNGGGSGTQKGARYKLNTYQFVQAVNQAKLCGYSDWRLPSAAELRNLVNIGGPGTPNGPLPAIPELQINGYWTATPDPEHSDRATVIATLYGYDSFLPKSGIQYAILVRGGVSP
ncbi:MAG: DUF1566 domain-containing protein [Gammaproteobacteria bacterium]